MPVSRIGGRVLLLACLAAVGSQGCSRREAPQARGSVGKTSHALAPGWTPASIVPAPAAWYVASASPSDVVLSDGKVSRWIDRTTNHRDALVQGVLPTLDQAAWNGHAALRFEGHGFMKVDPWSGPPAGTDAAFTVMAVVRSQALQNATIAGFWDQYGGGVAWAGVRATDGLTLPDFTRNHELVWTQPYAGPHDLGSLRHVIVWRYVPATQTIRITVDGTTTSSSPLPAIAPLPAMPLYIGASSGLPTGVFQGELSELVIVPGAASDDDVQNFTEYAQITWAPLPAQGSSDPCVDANGQPSPKTTRCDDGNAATYGDYCASGTCVGSVPPAGSPAELAPIAWYHAGAPEVVLTSGGVSTWYDRTSNHLDLLQGFYIGRPALVGNGWRECAPSDPDACKPTLRFNGSNVVRRDAWTGAPGGADAPFSMLAVVRSLSNQSAALASWWTRNAYGTVACRLTSAGSQPILDLVRTDEYGTTLQFADTRTVDGGRHVIAWRYAAGVARMTLDGATVSVTNTGPLGSIGGSEFLVGAVNDVAWTFFRGDIAELAVVPSSISDAQLESFESYAQAEWGGLPLASGRCQTAADCTGGLACVAGTCGAIDVDDGNACTVDTLVNGAAAHTPLPAGTDCSDANPCNGVEACNAAGSCVSSGTPNLDDGNPCTSDTCSASAGIQHVARAAGSACSDGNACNGFETCNGSGQCSAGVAPVTDDGNPCTLDGCSPATGVTHAPAAAGTGCSDGIACNGAETCNAEGTCAPGTPNGSCATTSCQSTALRVIDIRSDFRDVWAGRESIVDGKYASRSPLVTVKFNTPVDPVLVNASFEGDVGGTSDSPSDCSSAAATVSDWVPARPLNGGADSWRSDLKPAISNERAPFDFNLVAFHGASGNFSSEGPLAVGGTAALAGSSINQAVSAAIGLIVEGRLSGSNLAVTGDIVYGNAAQPPALGAGSVSGQVRRALPLDFERLYRKLSNFGATLAERPPNGTIQRQGTTLKLAGQSTGLNVFQLDAATLAQASAVLLEVPASASVLVNLAGASATIAGSVTLTGTDAGHVLWNFPHATAVNIGAASFSGSLLAPDAVVELGGGERFGTIVAASVRGAATLHARPLTAWASFGVSGNTTSVRFRAEKELQRGCQYRFRIESSPANSGGSCLPAPFETAFVVAPDERAAFDRELVSRGNGASSAPLAFRAAPGVNTLVDDVFDRYAEPLGLRKNVDWLVRSTRRGRSPRTPGRETAFFRQYYRGVPVDGYGYRLEHENELFRSATGHLLNDLTLDVVPALTSSAAISAALASVNPQQQPWAETPPRAPAPSAALLVTTTASTAVPALAWRVKLSGIPEVLFVDVDARTGAVLYRAPTRHRLLPNVACANFDPNVANYTGAEKKPVTVPLNGWLNIERNDLNVGLWDQSNTHYHAYMVAEPFPYRASFVDLTGNFPDLDAWRTASNAVDFTCVSDDPVAEQLAAVQWSIQSSAKAFSKLRFEDEAWRGMTGVDARPLVTRLLKVALAPGCEPPDPDCWADVVEHNNLITSYRPWADPSEPAAEEEIYIQEFDLDFPSISHEFAHGVLANARSLAGEDQLLLEGEAGSLDEAFADIMASYSQLSILAEDELDDAWCIPRSSYSDPGCLRDLANPLQSDPPDGALPDTYKVSPWCDYADSDCDYHYNSTVASHWFYLLVVGQDGSVPNGHGCSVSVNPIPLDAAAQIAFTAFSELASNATFEEAREHTADVAAELYDDETRVSVEQAWAAVGVGAAPRPSEIWPKDKDSSVNPWDYTYFEWTVGDQTGPWVFRYSTHSDFSDAEEGVAGLLLLPDGRRVAAAVRPLDPDTKYYWQGREGTPGGSANEWRDCKAFPASFTTVKKEITALTNKNVGPYYQLDGYGTFAWAPVPNAYSYQVAVTDEDEGCNVADDDWSLVGQSALAYVGDTVEPNSQIRAHSPTIVRPDDELDPDHTYHLYIRAQPLDPARPGACAHFPIRKTKLRPFTVVSPLDTPENGIPTLEYGKGGPFVWTPSDGAEAYRISFSRLVDGGTHAGGSWESLGQQVIAKQDLVQRDDGTLEAMLPERTPTAVGGQIFWDVAALQGEFSRRALEAGEQIELVNHRQFFASAAEAASFYYVSAGIWEQCGVESLGTIEHDGHSECPIEFPITDPGNPPPHEADVCVPARGNTVGALWWFGDSDAEYDFADVQDSPVFPHPADPASLCVGPSFLQFTSNDMLLIVRPYSNFYADGWHGLGPEHMFHFTTEDDCGYRNGPCCEGEGQARCAGSHLRCESGFCHNCGMTGEHKCDWGACAVTDRPRQANRTTHMCEDCGLPGEQCCNDDDTCWDEPYYDDENHPTFVKVCQPGNSNCIHCGQVGKPCCTDSSDPCPYAGDDVSCQGNKCVRNPAPEPADDPDAVPCGKPVPFWGHEGNASFTVNVDGAKGMLRIDFNTYSIRDKIIVREKSHPDTWLMNTDCIGTENYNGDFPSVEGTNWFHCDGGLLGDGSVPAEWETTDKSECWAEVPFDDETEQVVVEIVPHCFPYDQGTTDWDFKIGCVR